MMERLTKGNSEMAWYKGEYKGKKLLFEPCEVMSDCSSLDIGKILRRLAYYEDMEEQGRLVVLPCKVGDTAFFVIKGKIYEAQICIVQWYEHTRGVVSEIRGDVVGGSVGASISDIGKTVFLTREEAEKALKGGAK